MANERVLQTITLEAAADLSGKQFYLVKVDANGKAALTTGATDKPIGVLQNKPESGQAASVAIGGVSKVSADAAINEGAFLGSSADAQAVTLTLAGAGTTINYVVGQALTATAAAGELVEVLLTPSMFVLV